MIALLLACVSPDSGPGAESPDPTTDTADTADTAQPADSAEPVDSGDSGDTANSEDTADTGEVVYEVSAEAPPDWSLPDLNPASPRYDEAISPRDYISRVSGYYFIHST